MTQPQEVCGWPRCGEQPFLPTPSGSSASHHKQSLELRVKRGEFSDTVNHCFLAGCLPLLIQVAITHSEYLATN